jgi:phosphoglycerate kinase
MQCIDQVSRDELRGKKVLVRAGLDLPLDERGEVADPFRVKRAVSTLRFLKDAGARTVILSHIGRKPEETNEPVARALKHHIPITYVPDLTGHLATSALHAMKDGDIILLENLRRDPRETANDTGFANELANLGDIYVNDAFSAAHRAHASLVGIPKFLPHYAGILLCDEVKALDGARKPKSPSFAVLGGAKFETKAPLIKTLLETYDKLFITGALANDVFKARGLPVGRSKISDEAPGTDVLEHPNFIAPIDVTAEASDGHAKVKKPSEVTDDDKIVDIGPDTIAMLAPIIAEAKFILWNGPTGLYEDGYTSYTHALAELIQRRVAGGAQCVIGGGDTIAAIRESGVSEDGLGFLSTGGGAALEYLLEGTLPAIDAVRD